MEQQVNVAFTENLKKLIGDVIFESVKAQTEKQFLIEENNKLRTEAQINKQVSEE